MSIGLAGAILLPLVLSILAVPVSAVPDPPLVTLSASDPAASEFGDPGVLMFVRETSTFNEPLIVKFTFGGDADAADFTFDPGTCVGADCSVEIPAGQQSQDIIVTPADDAEDEPQEMLTASLVDDPANYDHPSPADPAVITIEDADIPTVDLAITDATADEEGPANGAFTFTRDGDDSQALNVQYIVAGSAVNGADYRALSGVATIPAGDPTVAVDLVPIDDAEDEGLEDVIIFLSTDGTYTQGESEGTITIADNDVPSVSITAPDPDASEQGPDAASFTLTRTGDSAGAVDVTVTLTGTADEDDYAVTGAVCTDLECTITIQDGASFANFNIVPVDDSDDEPSQTVVATVAPGDGYSPNPTTPFASANIADNDLPTVTVEATDAAAGEPANPGEFTFTRTDGDTTTPLVVSYEVDALSTATDTDDYTLQPTSDPCCTITILPGQTEATLSVVVVDDTDDEVAETVIVAILPSAADYVVGVPAVDTVIIADNDPPTVTVEATDEEAKEEGQETAAFTFTRTMGDTQGQPLTVSFALAGTATKGSTADYTVSSEATCVASACTITIAANEDAASFTVIPEDDTDTEDPETVTVQISPSGTAYQIGTPSSDSATIEDNEDPSVSVTATDATAAEGGTVADNGAFTLTRSGDPTNAITVSYTLSGDAVEGAGNDYTLNPACCTATIGAGAVTKVITLTAVDDTGDEIAETATLTLDDGVDYDVGAPAFASIVIADNDAPGVSVEASEPSASETGLAAGVFTISRTEGDDTGELTVFYMLGGTATNGLDYQTLAGTAVIAEDTTSVDVTLTPIDDSLGEAPEEAVLTILPPPTAPDEEPTYQVLAQDTATVDIEDNERPTVFVSVGTPLASESGIDGAFVLTRVGGDMTAPLSVAYTISGTADSDDYEPVSGLAEFAANEAAVLIPIVAVDDGDDEAVETVILLLTPNPSTYATVGATASGTLRILDDDDPTVTLTVTDGAAGESGNPGAFRFARAGETSTPLEVAYRVMGSAVNGADFTALSGLATIPQGATSANVIVIVTNDAIAESAEDIVLTLVDSPLYAVGTPDGGTITVADNDRPTVAVMASTPVASEANEVAGVFTFVRAGSDNTFETTISYTITGTASAPGDYAALTGTAVIAPGASSTTVEVVPEDDSTVEAVETVNVLITPNPAQYTATGAAVSATVRIVSNE